MSANLNLTKIKLGQNADPAKNFLISTPQPEDGTLTIERENGTDVMTVDAAGKVNFTAGIFGFSFGTANGAYYIKFPSWLNNFTVQWSSASPSGTTTVNLATNMANTSYAVSMSPIGNLAATNALAYHTTSRGVGSFQMQARYCNNGGAVGEANQTFSWIVVGQGAA